MMISGSLAVGTSAVPSDVDIFDVDLFETSSSTIQNLQARGAKVICYFSAGTSEYWRPDYNQFTSTDKGSELPDWKGEKYLNLRSANVLRIMKARIANAASIGCDAIDPDNMDGFTNTNGLGLAAADSTLFMRALAAEAAKYGMSTGLKNAQSIIASVADVVQFAVNEECKMVTKDCGVYDEFIAEKPVFHVEYVSSHSGNTIRSNYDGYQGMTSDEVKAAYCLKDDPTQAARFSTIIKTLALDDWVLYCDGKSAGWE
ncbi:hypothetical protein EG328_000782 [Venturia inaequalis]|uniref:alpha-galactosidase n=1 Tax=Venturia inaequalis TaxID=5025 RepID=A0A8H3Z8Y9_VENIN|nr:hypothetical protein EG328_000782 [Venturia inaequalis]KAE9990009.1 hypothetical protein EG327_001977 [Venturia inaequalis]